MFFLCVYTNLQLLNYLCITLKSRPVKEKKAFDRSEISWRVSTKYQRQVVTWHWIASQCQISRLHNSRRRWVMLHEYCIDGHECQVSPDATKCGCWRRYSQAVEPQQSIRTWVGPYWRRLTATEEVELLLSEAPRDLTLICPVQF